jgi:hypothetical protein
VSEWAPWKPRRAPQTERRKSSICSFDVAQSPPRLPVLTAVGAGIAANAAQQAGAADGPGMRTEHLLSTCSNRRAGRNPREVRPALAVAAYVRRCLRALLTPDMGASCPVAGASPSSASRARIARRAPSESPAASAASRAARCTAVACTRGLAAVSVAPSRSCRVSVARPGIAGLRSPIDSVRSPRSSLIPAASCSIGSISSHPEGDASRPPLSQAKPGGFTPRGEIAARSRRASNCSTL